MDNNIVAGLFGIGPQQAYQQIQQQGAAQDAQAFNSAGGTPGQLMAQAYSGVGRNAVGLGAGLMGIEPTAVTAARQQEQVMQGADTGTPEGLMAIAKRFNDAGMPQQAAMAVQAARQMRAEESKLNLESAHAKYYEQGRSGGQGGSNQLAAKQAIARNDLMKIGFQMGLSGQDLIDFTEEGVNRLTETWASTTGTKIEPPVSDEIPLSATTSISSGLNITDEQKSAMIQDALSRGDTVAAEKIKNIQVSPKFPMQSKAEVAGAVRLAQTKAENDPAALASGAAAKETGKSGADMNVKQYEVALNSKNNLQDIQRLEDHLRTSKAITGMGADLFKGIQRMKALLGDKAASGEVSDTEILDVMMGAEVFPLIKSLGIGARGMDTPAERDFMRKVITGEISLNKDTLLEMARLRRIAAERNIRMWNDRIDSGELDNFYNQTGRKKEKIDTDKPRTEMDALPPPSKFVGKTIRDTITGKRYRSNGTNWVLQ